jgi:hypothetical protein
MSKAFHRWVSRALLQVALVGYEAGLAELAGQAWVS